MPLTVAYLCWNISIFNWTFIPWYSGYGNGLDNATIFAKENMNEVGHLVEIEAIYDYGFVSIFYLMPVGSGEL